jgi:alpha-acetolactate decarboxylase
MQPYQDLHLIKRIARAINLQQKFMMKLKKKFSSICSGCLFAELINLVYGGSCPGIIRTCIFLNGFHVHFANDDRNFGGHVLDFEVSDVTVEIQNFETG